MRLEQRIKNLQTLQNQLLGQQFRSAVSYVVVPAPYILSIVSIPDLLNWLGFYLLCISSSHSFSLFIHGLAPICYMLNVSQCGSCTSIKINSTICNATWPHCVTSHKNLATAQQPRGLNQFMTNRVAVANSIAVSGGYRYHRLLNLPSFATYLGHRDLQTLKKSPANTC